VGGILTLLQVLKSKSRDEKAKEIVLRLILPSVFMFISCWCSFHISWLWRHVFTVV